MVEFWFGQLSIFTSSLKKGTFACFGFACFPPGFDSQGDYCLKCKGSNTFHIRVQWLGGGLDFGCWVAMIESRHLAVCASRGQFLPFPPLHTFLPFFILSMRYIFSLFLLSSWMLPFLRIHLRSPMLAPKRRRRPLIGAGVTSCNSTHQTIRQLTPT